MQDFHDYTEMKLGKPLLANDNEQLEHFVIPFREAIGAKRSRFEDVSLQAKYLTKKEWTPKHKDLHNSLHKVWTKTVAACFTARDTKDDLLSIRWLVIVRLQLVIGKGMFTNWHPMLIQIHRQMELLHHALDNLMMMQQPWQWGVPIPWESYIDKALQHDPGWALSLGQERASRKCDGKVHASYSPFCPSNHCLPIAIIRQLRTWGWWFSWLLWLGIRMV